MGNGSLPTQHLWKLWKKMKSCFWKHFQEIFKKMSSNIQDSSLARKEQTHPILPAPERYLKLRNLKKTTSRFCCMTRVTQINVQSLGYWYKTSTQPAIHLYTERLQKLHASNTGSSLNILQFDIQFTASIQLCIPGEPQPRGAENPALHLVMIPQGSQYHQKQQGTTYKGQLLLHFFKWAPSPPLIVLMDNNQEPLSTRVKNDKVIHVTGAKLALNNQYAPHINLQ